MPTDPAPSAGHATVRLDDLPDRLETGSTVLVASAGDVTRHAVPLRVLAKLARPDDSAVVVSTTEKADQTADRLERFWPDGTRPTLGFVDTVSGTQYISALYEDPPVVYTPAPGDLERLVLALSDISGIHAPADVNRHLVVTSLTPFVDATSADRVATVLDRIVGLRSEDGCCILGIDYTAHDQEAMSTIANRVEGVLWVTQPTDDRIELDYRPTRRQTGYSTLSESQHG